MVSKECPLCGGTKEVIERPPRLMGATYPENDPYKGDEHLEPCPLCEQKERSYEMGVNKVNEGSEAEEDMGFWQSRICPKCGEEISLDSEQLRGNCDLEGQLMIRCPVCHEGKLLFRVQPPLTEAEITRKALVR